MASMRGKINFLVLFFSIFLKANPINADDLMQQKIEHVVVVMLENRSFDNVFGSLYSEDNPLHFVPSDSSTPFLGLSEEVLNQYENALKDSSGQIVYSCPPIQGTPSTEGAKYLNSPGRDPNEPFDHVTKQIFGWGGGAEPSMLGFLQDFASLWNEGDWMQDKQAICAVMESFTAKELPHFYALARHYAVSDLWFSSVPTQTNPNRAFSVCGTSEGQIVNGLLGKSAFSSDTIWNRLAEESPETTWTIFWQTDMLPILFPGPFHSPRQFSALSAIPNLDQHYQKLDQFHELARQGQLPHFSFIEPQWTFADSVQLAEIKEEHPDYEYLLGIQGNDLHPAGDVRTAENFLANLYTSLISNKEAWKKTLFVVLFDEHGGIFDHVSPPASLAPDDHFEYGFAFDRYGVRTPALFISPLIKKGTVIRSDSAFPFDHTSLLGTLLKWKKIDPAHWNMGKRTAVAPTFEGVITKSVPRNDAILSISSTAASENSSLDRGDILVLKNSRGDYLGGSAWDSCATIGSLDASASLHFSPGPGKITHGSFVLIQLNDPSFCGEYCLDTESVIGDAYYHKNNHTPSQWWTLKSVDHPDLGYEIQEGDRVYLETHVYLDPQTFVPCRLTTYDSWIFGETVTTQAITDEGANDCYWFVEKNHKFSGLKSLR